MMMMMMMTMIITFNDDNSENNNYDDNAHCLLVEAHLIVSYHEPYILTGARLLHYNIA